MMRSNLALAPLFLLSLLTGHAHTQEVLVSGFGSDAIHRYRFSDGAFLGTVGPLIDPLGFCQGPDGHLYATEEGTDRVLRFHGTTFALIDAFVADDPVTPQDETGGLDNPTGALFGADGHLYVASFETDSVLKYDGTTGAFLAEFVSAGDGGLNGPDAGIAFGPDGHLYVPSFWNHRVLRYDGESGAFLDDFVSNQEGGIRNPRAVIFRSDGTLFVTGEGSSSVHRYDRNGDFLDTFVTWNAPTGLALHPSDGDLYVASSVRDAVRRYDGSTGAANGVLVSSGSGGLDLAVFLGFWPAPDLHLGRVQPGQAGVVNTLALRNATPGARVFLLLGSSYGSVPFNLCPHGFLGMTDPALVPLRADAAGSIDLATDVDPTMSGLALILQAVEMSSCRISNLVQQTLK